MPTYSERRISPLREGLQRLACVIACAGVAMTFAVAPCAAQDPATSYPNKPIRLPAP